MDTDKMLNEFYIEETNKFNSEESCNKEYDSFFKLNDDSELPTSGTAMIHPDFNYDNEEFEENASW